VQKNDTHPDLEHRPFQYPGPNPLFHLKTLPQISQGNVPFESYVGAEASIIRDIISNTALALLCIRSVHFKTCGVMMRGMTSFPDSSMVMLAPELGEIRSGTTSRHESHAAMVCLF
jgi:hypothetical protein